MKQSLDVLAFGTHPDDVELACGGTLILLANRGHHVGAADLTRGELGMRGSEPIRAQEAARSSQILKVSVRENLGIPDGQIETNQENLFRVIRTIRQYRPRLVLAPYWEERHYDHVHASRLIAEAAFYSGLAKIETGQDAFRPYRVLFYAGRMSFRPSFVVDISETFEAKMQAVRSYRSQFHAQFHAQFHEGGEEGEEGMTNEPQTFISTPYALEVFETVARYYGAMIGARYGEPFFLRETLEIADPVNFFREFPDTKQPHLFPS